MPERYDVAIIGAGTGGYACALRAAELGLRVLLIERDERLGGTCLLRGCIPTKALLRSAEVMDNIRRSEEWGIKSSGEPDWPGVQRFQKRVVDKLVSGVTGLVKTRGIEVRRGTATLGSEPRLQVDGKAVDASNVVIATGSSPRLLPGVSVSNRVITSDQALTRSSIPSSAIVIGAGAVGLEFASFYRSMGAEVTVLEGLDRIAPLEDEDISKELARAYRKRGISTTAGVKVTGVEDGDDGATVTYEAGGAKQGRAQTTSAEIALVAIGRGPNTEDLGLEEAGVELDRGFVKVNGSMSTTAEGVWAVGDVAATPLQLAHVSFAEGIGTAERIAGQEVPEIDYTGVPRVTYCTPEVASVGLTEAQAKDRGHELDVEKYNFQAIGKANIVGEGGIVKVLAEKAGGPVLGIHMVGPHVTDLISEAMLITNWEALPADVAALIHPHPTLSEAVGEAHLALAGKPLHSA
ncbi:MAG: dihydrolipoyl dehydrogenase [Actinomycetota bacterium]|nr:dihydrolipoyl dehydrogenase [Actinomycetota bacterium]